ncbi:type II toxin-antitoxin system VapC family toxin [Pseudonocardia acaciae]|uniref:type II toxin-antitoxin system VapC family toxin n=1 Tax=Pseudonocardia acaciae TaxID=551276 RepID=UPI00048A57A7|nr:type II toxin-antitoxin system VapC family toxin [Pseudonocardia acaciae]
MTEFVVDASAAVKGLIDNGTLGRVIRQRMTTATCHAPHLLDAEVGNVLRRAERVGKIDEDEARTALAALPRVIDERYPHTGRFAELAWEIRHTISFYDGLYVALATVLELPLLTSDVRLSKAPGLSCEVELVA